MENRGTLCFLVGALPRQPNQRRQSACSRDSPCAQPRSHRTAAGGLDLTAKPDLSRRAVPTLAHQARCSQSHHRHGAPPRPTGLSHAEIWSAVHRQRGGILRAKKPPTTNRVRQKEGRPTRPAGHTSSCVNLPIKKFLESRVTVHVDFGRFHFSGYGVNQALTRFSVKILELCSRQLFRIWGYLQATRS